MSGSSLLVDTGVRPYFRSNAEIREFLPPAFSRRGMPDVESWWYGAPGGDYHERLTGDAYPGSDPEVVAAHVLDEQGVDIAVLNPLTRGNLPDYRLNSAICAATNDWLAQRWLDEGNPHKRFRGTIRVNPEDPAGAVAEIERWAGHPHMVQIGIPLQSREPYGKPQFLPIWEATAAARLPIAVQVTGGAGIEFAPTPAGHARTYPHYAAFFPLNYFIHLSSLIMDGIFDKFPDLVFVFANGGIDILTPLAWRLDDLWIALRDQTPWVELHPSEYLSRHVRFCSSKLEGPPEPEIAEQWFAQMGKEDILMFGSSYPHWSWQRPDELPLGMSDEQVEKVRWRTANELYGLGLGVTVASA